MALLMPQSQLARNVDAILSQIRKGCARARVANMGDPTLGIMVDLPDGVEFEITVVREYQTLSRISEERNNGTETGFDTTTGSDRTIVKGDEATNRRVATSDDKSKETSSEDTTELGVSLNSVQLSEGSTSGKSSSKGSSSKNTKTDKGSGTSRTIRVTKKDKSFDNKEATLITESKIETDAQTQTGGKSTRGVVVDFSQNARAYLSFEDETGAIGGQLTLGLLMATPSLGTCPTE